MKLRPIAAAAVGILTLTLLGSATARLGLDDTAGSGAAVNAVPAPPASSSTTPSAGPTPSQSPSTSPTPSRPPSSKAPGLPSAAPHPEASLLMKVIPPKRTPTPTPPPSTRSTTPRSTAPGSTPASPSKRPSKPKSSKPKSTVPVSCTVTVAGVKVTVAKSEHTRTVVNGNGGTRATISMIKRTDLKGCQFTTVFTDGSGRVGYNGLANGNSRKQGSGTTPTGTYSVTEAFGLNGNPGTALSYRHAGANDWWILDFQKAPKSIWNSFYRYNGQGYKPTEKSSNDTESEKITSYPGQYAYSAVLNFNRPGDPAGMNSTRGGGIFLHVNGSGATAGCVSTTRTNVVKFLTNVRPGDRVTIVA